MKSLKFIFCLAWTALSLVLTPRASANNAGAVVLVNSSSAKYVDFQHFIQPYLGNFGVPYTVLDIAGSPVTNLTNYALIIIGHAQLDTNLTYLTPAAQSNISLAVSNGVGLVSFDNVLASNTTPLYQFEQTIFGLGYTSPSTSPTVEFPPTGSPPQMSYITSLHLANETLTLSNANNLSTMTVAGLTLPGNVTAVATSGGAPFVVTVKYGQGRAVQWASYDWMSTTVQGPVNGLDDLVWRGFTWAARKPFVMRGMPNFATIRIDDVMGYHPSTTNTPVPFWWVHAMTNVGFKPWLALFTDDLSYASQYFPADDRIVDLSNMVANGMVSVSVHSFSADADNFFYFDHQTETDWSDSVMSNNFDRGMAFLQWAGIPQSKAVIAHYNEVGDNAFNGLTNWGVEYFLLDVVPATVEFLPPYASWLVGGPYRLYETPQIGETQLPLFYADWLTIPNHPELNGKFFDCYTEIRNVGPLEDWEPTNDVAGSIDRGYRQIKRGFDSLTLGNIFTHEFFIQNCDGPDYGNIDHDNFAAIMQGITNALASYNPIFVTMDYACQYVRARKTSQLTSADYNPANGQVTATFTGSTDLSMTAYYYTGVDSGITNNPGTVPIFSGSANVTLGQLTVAPATLLVTANNQSRTYGATNPVLTYTITGFQGNDTITVVTGAPGLSTAATNFSQVGTYPITIINVNLSAPNYIFTFANGNLTVGQAALLVSADNQSRNYGTANPALTYTTTGFLGTDTVMVVSGAPGLTTAATNFSQVGTYPITITNVNLTATNYSFNFNNGNLTVNQAALLVSANNQNRAYGTENPLLTYTTSGFLGTDTVMVVSGAPGLSTAATTFSQVGTYPIAITNVNLSATNYSFNFNNGNLTVNQAALLVSADNQSRNYGTANPALTYTTTGFLGTDTVMVVSGAPGLTTAATNFSQVGTYPITITNVNLTATNYSFNFTNGNLTVGQAALLVSANNQNRAYGTENPLLTYTTSGFLGTDTVMVVSGAPGLSTAATTFSQVGTYPIAITNVNLSATNYSFNFNNGNLTVNQAALLVSADNQSRNYGTANPVLTYTTTGFLGTDTVMVVSGAPGLSTAATTFSQVGTYPITITNVNLTATNYSFNFTNGNLTVGQAALLVSADNQNRAYGTENPLLTYTTTGFLGTDTVMVVSGAPGLSTAATTFSQVGTYPIAITNVNLSATNYSFNFTNGNLTVNQAALLVSADNQSRPYGTNNPVLTYTMSGFLGTDTVEVVSGVPALGTAADNTSPVGSYAITVTNGNLAATNYNFAFANGTLTVAATAPVILSITGGGTPNVLITWSSLSNAIYRVRYATDLNTTTNNWQNLVPDVTATNSTASLLDNPGSATRRFYQVIVP